MPATATEVNFDGIVGPTYNKSALAPPNPGNLASMANRGRPTNPKAAALEGLAKAETVMRLGVTQAVLPPLMRPNREALYRIGLIKDRALLETYDARALAAHLATYADRAPQLLAACFSGSSLWTANWATVSPSADTNDGKVHMTPSNMSSQFHRSLEPGDTVRLLRQIFAATDHFVVHDPLPQVHAFGDEGAANHLRLALLHGNKGLNVFVYGRDGFDDYDPARRYPARQTRVASETVARLHGLDSTATVFKKQSPIAIDAGVFHNDVIASANLDLLFFHQHAFDDPSRAICDLNDAFFDLTGRLLRTAEVKERDLPLEQAVASYLFNGQIVNDCNGRTILIAPRECQLIPAVRRFLSALTHSDDRPFDDIVFVNTTSSMQSGGGPACLRLRVVLTDEELEALSGRVLLTDDLLRELRALIEMEYPDKVLDQYFTSESFLKTCFDTTRRLYSILDLAPSGLQ